MINNDIVTMIGILYALMEFKKSSEYFINPEGIIIYTDN